MILRRAIAVERRREKIAWTGFSREGEKEDSAYDYLEKVGSKAEQRNRVVGEWQCEVKINLFFKVGDICLPMGITQWKENY